LKLATVSEVITMAELPSTYNKDVVLSYLKSLSSFAQTFMNRKFAYQQYIEYFTSEDHRFFYLSAPPINTAAAYKVEVNEDGSYVEKTVNDDYYVHPESGAIEFYEAVANTYPRNVRITYYGGYAELSVNTAKGTWAASHAYVVGNRISAVSQTDGLAHAYRVTVAGTSGLTIPVLPITVSTTVVDGGVTWKEDSDLDGTIDIGTDLPDVKDKIILQAGVDLRKRKSSELTSASLPNGSLNFADFKYGLLPIVVQTLRYHRNRPYRK
jgi:hypothetical protein